METKRLVKLFIIPPIIGGVIGAVVVRLIICFL